jgi:hypothetical protein
MLKTTLTTSPELRNTNSIRPHIVGLGNGMAARIVIMLSFIKGA